MNTVDENTDQPPSLDIEESQQLMSATEEKLLQLRISGPLRDKIRKLVMKDAQLTYDVLLHLETARRRMRGRLEHRIDNRLHEFNPAAQRPARDVHWRKY